MANPTNVGHQLLLQRPDLVRRAWIPILVVSVVSIEIATVVDGDSSNDGVVSLINCLITAQELHPLLMVLFERKMLPGWSSFQPTNGHKVWGLQALQVNEEIPTCGTLGHIFCLS